MSRQEKEKVGFHYRRDGQDLGWAVGKSFCSSSRLGPSNAKPLVELTKGQTPNARMDLDCPRQGLYLSAKGRVSLRASAGDDTESYWSLAMEWMQEALSAAGVTQALEETTSQVLQASFSDQKFNISLALSFFLFQLPVNKLHAKLDFQNQGIALEVVEESKMRCPKKRYEFTVDESGRLQHCRVIIDSKRPMKYTIQRPKIDENKPEEILTQTAEFSEDSCLEIEFKADGPYLHRSYVSIESKSDSFIHYMLEKGAECVVADQYDEVSSIPFFADDLSFFDRAKKYFDSETVCQIIAFRLKKIVGSEGAFGRNLKKYAEAIEAELKSPFIKLPTEKKRLAHKTRKFCAAMEIYKSLRSSSLDRLMKLKGYQNELSDGRLKDLFAIYMKAAGSRPEITDVAEWFKVELALYQGKPAPASKKGVFSKPSQSSAGKASAGESASSSAGKNSK